MIQNTAGKKNLSIIWLVMTVMLCVLLVHVRPGLIYAGDISDETETEYPDYYFQEEDGKDNDPDHEVDDLEQTIEGYAENIPDDQDVFLSLDLPEDLIIEDNSQDDHELVQDALFQNYLYASAEEEISDTLLNPVHFVLPDPEPIPDQTYTGEEIKPEITIYNGGYQLTADQDYEVSYTDNIEPGTASVSIRGLGAYSGSAAATFRIIASSMEWSDLPDDAVPTEMEYVQWCRLCESSDYSNYYFKTGSISGDDYTVEFIPIRSLGKHTVTLVGTGDYEGYCRSYETDVVPSDLSRYKSNLFFTKRVVAYTGKPVIPGYYLSDEDDGLFGFPIKGVDYDVICEDNVTPGLKTIRLQGKGNWTGSIVSHYTIVRDELVAEHHFDYVNDVPVSYDCEESISSGQDISVYRREDEDRIYASSALPVLEAKNPRWVFLGWSDEKESYDSKPEEELLFIEDKDVTLYSKWGYNVRFVIDWNGNTPSGAALNGTWMSLDPVKTYEIMVPEGSKVMGYLPILYNSLSFDFGFANGKVLKGWNTASDGKGTDARTLVASTKQDDMKLYAIWEDMLTITLDGNGGQFQYYAGSSSDTAQCQLVTGDSVSKAFLSQNNFIHNLNRVEYLQGFLTHPEEDVFSGWSLDPEGLNRIDPETYVPEHDVKLYAVWEKNFYDVSFEAGEGYYYWSYLPQTREWRYEYDNKISSITVPVPCGSSILNILGAVFASSHLIPSNSLKYVFKGWKDSVSGKVYSEDEVIRVPILEPHTFQAVWDVSEPFEITLNANGKGMFGDEDSSATVQFPLRGEWDSYNNETGSFYYPDSFYEEAYVCIGYSDRPDGAVIDFRVNPVTGPGTYYAIWSKSYSVIWDYNGGYRFDSTNYSYDKRYEGKGGKLPLVDSPASTGGAEFLGWSLERDGEPLSKEEYESIRVEGDMTLYAVWDISFDSGSDDTGGGSHVGEVSVLTEKSESDDNNSESGQELVLDDRGHWSDTVSWIIYRIDGSEELLLRVIINDSEEASYGKDLILKDFSSSSSTPWNKYRSQIKKLEISVGSISNNPKTMPYIGRNAFTGLDNLKHISISSGTDLEIGEKAFSNLPSLEELDISLSSYRTFKADAYAFAGCSALKKVDIPGGKVTLGDRSFFGCGSLTEVIISGEYTPGRTIIIDSGAFADCGALRNICFQETVPEASYDMFSGTSQHMEVNIVLQSDERNLAWADDLKKHVEEKHDDVTITVNSGHSYSGDAGRDCVWSLNASGTLRFTASSDSARIDTDSRPWIEQEHIRNYIKSIVIEQGIVGIGEDAFSGIGHAVDSISFPQGLETIEGRALQGFQGKLCFNGGKPQYLSDTFLMNSQVQITIPFGDLSWDTERLYEGMQYCGGEVSWCYSFGNYVYGFSYRPDHTLTVTGNVTDNLIPDDIMNLIKDEVRVVSISPNISIPENDPFREFPSLNEIVIDNPKGYEAKYYYSDGILRETDPKRGKGDSSIHQDVYYYSADIQHDTYSVRSNAAQQDITVFKNKPNLKNLYIPDTVKLTGSDEEGFSSAAGYGFTVYCGAGTQAEEFCKENSIRYECRVGWDNLAYSFSNSYNSFGDTSYRISSNAYETIWGKRRIASYIYSLIRGWSGNCFGMSASSQLFNSGSTLLTTDMFSNFSTISRLHVGDRSGVLNMNLQEVIEALQVSQYTLTVQSAYLKMKNHISEICSLADNAMANGIPVLIGMFGGNGKGHLLLGYSLEKVNDKTEHLMVYDCNFPNDGHSENNAQRYIELTKNSSGEYVSWRYPFNDMYWWGSSYGNYWITYVPFRDISYVWGHRGILRSEGNISAVGSSEAAVYDESGARIALIKNGALAESTAAVSQIISAGAILAEEGQETVLRFHKDGIYTIENLKPEEDLAVSMANTDSDVSVVTSAPKVRIAASDANGTCVVEILSSGDDSYEIDTNSTQGGAPSSETYSGVTKNNIHTVVSTKDGELADEIEAIQPKPAGGSKESEERTVASAGNNVSLADVGSNQKDQGSTAKADVISSDNPATDYFLTLNENVVVLKKNQSTNGLKISMAKGDSIAKVSVSKKKIASAVVIDPSAGIIRLTGKKVGKTKVQIMLASGVSGSFTIKVQKKKVSTKSIITNLPPVLSLKTGERCSIEVELSPFTTRDKVTYRSSNKKAAIVSRKGVITARKAGTAKITIRSGKKKKVVRVVVS